YRHLRDLHSFPTRRSSDLVSRSVDATKFHLQREGYVEAMTSPQVVDAIRSGANGRIAVCLVEWSGASSQKLVIDWTLISDANSRSEEHTSELQSRGHLVCR